LVAAGGTVTVSGRRSGNLGEVVITDTGVGLAPDDVERVFERFYRAPEQPRPAGGTVAGGTVAGGTVLVAGELESAVGDTVLRGATGAGFHSAGVGPAGRSGSWESASPKADGGHAGIVCSVGGSGGQMSLCVGIPASGCAFGGQVRGADRVGAAVGLGSGSPAASAGAGTVWAHEGAGFCMGTADFGFVSSSATGAASAGGLVCAHDGAVFCIGRAGFGSPSRVACRASVPRGAAGSDAGSSTPTSTGLVSAVVSAGSVSVTA